MLANHVSDHHPITVEPYGILLFVLIVLALWLALGGNMYLGGGLLTVLLIIILLIILL